MLFSLKLKERKFWDFPGSPKVKTPHFQCRGHRSIPGPRGAKSHMPAQPKPEDPSFETT